MADDREMFFQLEKFQELFSGRFSTEEAAIILQRHDDLQAAVSFVLNCEPDEVRRLIEEDQNSWTNIERKIRRLRNNPSILDRARSGKIDTTVRLFACGPCDSFWWRRTPTRKQVSRCRRCGRRYDAVPHDREWGWAEFSCPTCMRTFFGSCAMYMRSPCLGCGSLVYPTRIVPPNERIQTSRHTHFHICAAPDCPGREHYRGALPIGQLDPNSSCVHPASRLMRGLPKVVNASRQHRSTGSTVKTFLSQTDLCKQYDQYFPSLSPIPGSDDSDDGDHGTGSSHPV